MITELNASSLIAEASIAEGSLTFFSRALVFGVVEGSVVQQASEPLQIGKTGWVRGDINSQGSVLIEGRVEGNIISSFRITLAPTARVTGCLHAPKIEIKAGAHLEGEIMTKKPPARLKVA
ncbi:MAG: polymer-forming cytoskeletal protein [Deltaproteobacteria bacterium]|nr:polymer-forming cytoskeletal protein [Deltaproteobacteria bacterium]